MPKSIVLTKIKRLSEQTKIDHWTVKFLGDLERDPTVETEAKVNVLLQPFERNTVDCFSNFPECENSQYRIIKLGLGQLPILNIGSIWYKGRLTASQFGSRASYRIKNSADSGRHFLTAWEKIDSYRYYIPPNHFRIPRRLADAEILKIDGVDEDGETVQLYVPAMVLNRAYICRTSNLTKWLFDGTMIHNMSSLVDLDESNFFQTEGKSREEIEEYLHSLRLAGSGRRGLVNIDPDTLYEVLAQQITSDDEARVLAKVLVSKNYQAAVNSAVNSCMTKKADGKRVHPRGLFPFTGESDISVMQVPLLSKKGETEKYLVTRIEKCSASKPYGDCVVYRKNDGSQAPPETDNADDDKKIIVRRPKKEHPESDRYEIQDEQDADTSVEQYELDPVVNGCEPLADELPLKPTKVSCEYKSAGSILNFQEDDATLLGTSDGYNSGTNVTPTNIDSTGNPELRRGHIPTGFDFFSQSVLQLNKIDGFCARLRARGQIAGLIPAKIMKGGPTDWAYLDYASSKVRNFMVADLFFKDRNFILIEIERRPNEAFKLEVICARAKSARISDAKLDDLLHRLARKRGQLIKIKPLPFGLVYPSRPGKMRRIHGVRHSWPVINGDVSTAVGRCAERVADHIIECYGSPESEMSGNQRSYQTVETRISKL